MKNISAVIFIAILLVFTGCSEEQTSLEIQVTNCKGQVIKGAHVELYNTDKERKLRKNMIDEKITNGLGLVLFEDLQPKVYYYHSYRRIDTSYYTNKTSGGVNISTIEPLVPGQVNTYFIQICEEL